MQSHFRLRSIYDHIYGFKPKMFLNDLALMNSYLESFEI